MAVARLLAEALPAIHHGMKDPQAADTILAYLELLAKTLALDPLMDSHDLLQGEFDRMDELQYWGGARGHLINSATMVACLFDQVCACAATYAPQSNPQARLVALEAAQHLAELKAALEHFAAS